MLQLQNTVTRAVTGVTFTSDGRLIAGGSGGFDVWALDGTRCRFVKQPALRNVYAFEADPWGMNFYHSTYITGLHRFPLDGFQPERLPGSKYDHHVISLSISEPGRRLAVSRGGAGSNRIECWAVNPSTGELTADWALRNRQRCLPSDPFYLPRGGEYSTFSNCVTFDTTGTLLYASIDHRQGGQSEAVLTVLTSATGETVGEVRGCRAGFMIDHLALPGGRLAIWSTAWIELWDIKTGCRIAACTSHGRGHITAVAVHPSGRFLASAGRDRKLRLWNVDDLAPLRAFDWKIGKLHSITFNREGTLAAAGGDKGKVMVWDVDH